ncbi:MAG: hypothetical protein DWI47_00445 [Chloroflexi bacterium]|nr:MAG: hypothetical protein DWI47_00445 [Chloroflexota bacterium]
MNKRSGGARPEPPRRSGGARPFGPGEAPLGVRPGLSGQRRRAGVEAAARPGQREAVPTKRRGGGRRLRPETLRVLRRLAVLVLMLCALVAPPALASSGTFKITSLRLVGLQLLDEEAVSAVSGVVLGDGLLTSDPHRIEQVLSEIPFVASARVRIGLPGEIRAEIREEIPLLRWSSGGLTYLMNGSGELLGPTTSPLLNSAGRAAVELLPLMRDLRSGPPLLTGDAITPLDVDISTRLASLTLADLGSTATRLSLVIDPQYGFVLQGEGEGIAWNAVFGIYSATIRPPEMLPGQVRLLRSLLAGRERRIGWVILADGQAGTFTAPGVRPPAPPRASAAPSLAPSPVPSGSTVTP